MALGDIFNGGTNDSGGNTSTNNSPSSYLVAKEPFAGSATTTNTFTQPMSGFVLSNDGDKIITVTILGENYPVDPGEVFDENFDLYTQVKITTTVPFRAYGKALMVNGTTATFPTDLVPPSNVENVKATNIASDSAKLSWNASLSPNVVSYEVWSNATGRINLVTDPSYDLVGLTPNTAYTFVVRAVNDKGAVSNGTAVTMTTLPSVDYSPPSNVPSVAIGVITEAGTTVYWEAVQSQNVDGYDVYVNDAFKGSTSSQDTRFELFDLTISTKYKVTVKTRDTRNRQSSGTSLTFTTAATGTDSALTPLDVTDLRSDYVLPSTITLMWNRSLSGDVTSYEVYARKTTDLPASDVLVATVFGTVFTINGLDANTQYTFTVKAKNVGGKTSVGTTFVAKTAVETDSTPPRDVTNLAADTIGDHMFKVTWAPSGSIDIASYDVYLNGQLSGNTVTHDYTFASLLPQTAFTVLVKAKDSNGNISKGTDLTVTTLQDITPPTVTASPVAGYYPGTQVVTLAADEPASVYYTLDGSTPNTSSTVYSTGIVIASTKTLKYFAKDPYGNASEVKTALFTIDTVAPTVQASPSGGAFASDQTVTLTMSEAGTIYYTLDGTDPTTSSPVYSGPIQITTSTVVNKTLKFLAKDLAGNLSAIQTANFTVDKVPPVVSITPPAPGNYTTSQAIALTANETATIYYTTDGFNPTTNSLVYNGPLMFSADVTIKYFAVDAVGNASTPQSTFYHINLPPADVTGLTRSNLKDHSVTLSWVANTEPDIAGYEIYNGATLLTTVTGTSYNVTGLNPTTTYTFKVLAKDAEGNRAPGGSGAMVTITTTADIYPPTVTATPASGATSNVTLVSDEPGTTIYYTTDGTDPTISSPVYSDPILIPTTTIVKWIGKDAAGNVSTVQSATFTNPNPTAVTSGLIGDFIGTNAATTSADHKIWYDQSPAHNDITITPNGASVIAATQWDAVKGFQGTANISKMDLPYNAFNDYPITWEFVVKAVAGSTNELTTVVQGTANYRMMIDGTGALNSFKTTGGGSAYITQAIPNIQTQYVHIVLTFTGTVNELFVNGSKIATVTSTWPAFTDDATVPLPSTTYARAAMGSSANTLVKRMRMYNRVLTNTEILNNYYASQSLLG